MLENNLKNQIIAKQYFLNIKKITYKDQVHTFVLAYLDIRF